MFVLSLHSFIVARAKGNARRKLGGRYTYEKKVQAQRLQRLLPKDPINEGETQWMMITKKLRMRIRTRKIILRVHLI